MNKFEYSFYLMSQIVEKFPEENAGDMIPALVMTIVMIINGVEHTRGKQHTVEKTIGLLRAFDETVERMMEAGNTSDEIIRRLMDAK
jgi:hypothetical protein